MWHCVATLHPRSAGEGPGQPRVATINAQQSGVAMQDIMRALETAPRRKQPEKQKMGMHLETCTSWTKHGYGFVQPDRPIPGIERDLFIGSRSLLRAGINKLERGDRVSFDIGRTKDGRPEATNIQIIEALAA
jgi:CspA family cold shock protein